MQSELYAPEIAAPGLPTHSLVVEQGVPTAYQHDENAVAVSALSVGSLGTPVAGGHGSQITGGHGLQVTGGHGAHFGGGQHVARLTRKHLKSPNPPPLTSTGKANNATNVMTSPIRV